MTLLPDYYLESKKGVISDSLRDLLSVDTDRDLEHIRNNAYMSIEKS